MPSGPSDGDMVLYCAHPELEGQHFFQVRIPFKPPDSFENLVAQWVIQCDDCFATLPKKPEVDDFIIAGHDTWVGGEPTVDYPPHEMN